MIPPELVPADDPRVLSRLAAEAMRVNGALLGEIFLVLPEDKHDAIRRLLAGGGSIGVETLVDRRQSIRVLVVGIEREGTRRILAEVVGPPSCNLE